MAHLRLMHRLMSRPGACKLQPRLGLGSKLLSRSPVLRCTASRSEARTNDDVIVVGLGAFGSSTAYHLARSGARVLGIDRHAGPGHPWGSSHGHTRIIRLAYAEGEAYVPLLRRSYNLFLELQQDCKTQLFVKTGMVDVGPDQSTGNSLASAQRHGLEHELLTGAQLNERFPGFGVPPEWQAVYQPDGGMLLPEACIQAHCAGAEAAGAQLLWTQTITSFTQSGSSVEVRTAQGDVHTADQVVLAAGPWMCDILPETKSLLTVVRQVVGWFPISDASRHLYAPDRFPVFILDSGGPLTTAGGSRLSGAWYGFPEWQHPQPGFKIGLYNHLNEEVHPDTIPRTLTTQDDEVLRVAVRQYFPGVMPAAPLLAHSTCMFTNTPDGHFLVDRHPVHPNILICSACSGHGFKMSSGVGQLIAEDVMAWQGGSPAQQAARPELAELLMHRLDANRPGHANFLNNRLSFK